MTITTQAPTRRRGVKCHHGDDAPRDGRGTCKICRSQSQARYRAARKALGPEPERQRIARCVCGAPVAQSVGQWDRWFCSEACLDALAWRTVEGLIDQVDDGGGVALVMARRIRIGEKR